MMPPIRHLTPEQQAKIEAICTANRTPEARARHAAIRAQYADRPGSGQLLERGEISRGDFERIMQHYTAGPPTHRELQ